MPEFWRDLLNLFIFLAFSISFSDAYLPLNFEAVQMIEWLGTYTKILGIVLFNPFKHMMPPLGWNVKVYFGTDIYGELVRGTSLCRYGHGWS